jgi:hypothetical protein
MAPVGDARGQAPTGAQAAATNLSTIRRYSRQCGGTSIF